MGLVQTKLDDAISSCPATREIVCSHRHRSAIFVCTTCEGDASVCDLCAGKHSGHSLYAIDGYPDVATALRKHISELCDEALVPSSPQRGASETPTPAPGQTLQNSLEAALTQRVVYTHSQLDAVPGSLAAAITELRSTVPPPGAADTPALVPSLSSQLETIARLITASLEAELVSLDTALEAVRAEFGAVRAAVDALAADDRGLVHAHGALVDRLWEGPLERARRQLSLPALSPAACSVPCLGDGLLGGPPHPALLLRAEDLVVRSLQDPGPHVTAGAAVQLAIGLKDSRAQPTADAWALLLRAVRLVASLCTAEGACSVQLESYCLPVPRAGDPQALIVAVDVPVSARAGAALVLEHVTAWGRVVDVEPPAPLPLTLQVLPRPVPLRTPASAALRGAAFLLGSSPCVSAAGELYVPVPGMAELRAGSALLLLEELGLSRFTCAAAFDDAGGTLLLADVRGCCVVALDAASRAVRWRYETGSPDGTCALAVLPRRRLVAVSALPANAVHLLRLSDGARASCIDVDMPVALAADAATDTLFVSCRASGGGAGEGSETRGCPLRAWRFSDATQSFVELRATALAAAGLGSDRPIAVVPAPLRSWSAHAHLVVGEMSGPGLRVLSLPGLALVHAGALEGARIVGLAGDPAGSALVVCDYAAQAVRVLPWPLAGGGAAAAIAQEGRRGQPGEPL